MRMRFLTLLSTTLELGNFLFQICRPAGSPIVFIKGEEREGSPTDRVVVVAEISIAYERSWSMYILTYIRLPLQLGSGTIPCLHGKSKVCMSFGKGGSLKSKVIVELPVDTLK